MIKEFIGGVGLGIVVLILTRQKSEKPVTVPADQAPEVVGPYGTNPILGGVSDPMFAQQPGESWIDWYNRVMGGIPIA